VKVANYLAVLASCNALVGAFHYLAHEDRKALFAAAAALFLIQLAIFLAISSRKHENPKPVL
jgi:ACR3 family arsenite efflux pump ArsB